MSNKKWIALGIFLIGGALLLTPELCLSAAQSGLLLWFNKVLPSLLPFMILVNLLVGINIMHPISQIAEPFTQKLWHMKGTVAFAFLIGLVSGYPMGGKALKALYDQNELSLPETERALFFCNNCGPLFIIGTVGTAMLGHTDAGYFLFLVHIVSALLMSLLICSAPMNSSTMCIRTVHISSDVHPMSFATLFSQSIQNAMDTIVCVGGYIIFFSTLTAIITHSSLLRYILGIPIFSHISTTYTNGLMAGFLELSNGTASLSNAPYSPLTLAFLSAIISFGGLCVYFQTLHVLGGISIRTPLYFLAKLIQGILSFLLCYILYPLFSMYTAHTPMTLPLLWLFLCLTFFLISRMLFKQFISSNNTIPLPTKEISKNPLLKQAK